MATRNGDEIDVLLWNYHDADVEAASASIQLHIDGVKGALTESEYLVDKAHSNAYAAWLKMGSPAHPDAQQKAALVKAAELEETVRDRALAVKDGEAVVALTLARQGVALIRLKVRPEAKSD
jgi:xylan 1,4-beta-xylosidase